MQGMSIEYIENIMHVVYVFTFSSPPPSQTPQQYLQAYNRRRGQHYSRFHGYAYDGIWVIAKAMDYILKKNKHIQSGDIFRSPEMYDALNNTDFIGVTVSTPYQLLYTTTP